MPDLVYVIGAPGVGKTTAVAELVGPAGWTEVPGPIPHLRRGGVVMPGRARAPFGGTDTLGMGIARAAEAWVASVPAALVIGEGDRLAYGRFFDVATSAGYRLHLIVLELAEWVAEQRRAARAAEAGLRPQNPAWVRGRESKSARLAADYGAYRVDASGSPGRSAAQMRSWLVLGGVQVIGCDYPISSI
jgi:hypothetical protein